MNPRFDNNEAAVLWEDIALDVRSGVEFLKGQPDVTKVVLFGHSGGGPTMTFYQAVAEQGPAYCRGPEKLVECGDGLARLPPADGVVLVDAHPGNPVNTLRSLNPAVMDESDPRHINPELDPFRLENGFAPVEAPRYSEGFKRTYFRAQAARMNRLIDRALDKVQRMKDGTDVYPDDDVFLVVRAAGARLLQLDPTIHHRTDKPQKLLRDDATLVRQIVESVRPVFRARAEQDATFRGARLLTVRSFLSAHAIRATDSMDGIDWCSSNNSTSCALQNISVPILITAMGGHYFVRDNEIHYELAASKDKDFVVIDGATHRIAPCTACGVSAGQYANSVNNFFDYVQDWINARF
jgi:pimeloyl-ACP methyl ester carboxylesterase